MLGAGLVAATVAMLATSCGSDTTGVHQVQAGAAQLSAVQPPKTAVSDPLALIGLWRVRAKGEPPSTALRLGRDLMIWRTCATLDGAWKATADGAFLGDRHGWSARCSANKTGSTETPDWLRRAVAYRVAGPDRQLLDGTGAVVATLLPGGRPTPDPKTLPALAKPPAGAELAAISAALRSQVLPSSQLAAPTRTSLLGTWYPESPLAGVSPTPPRLEIKADGVWSASDGCNRMGGRWLLGAAGVLLATSGMSHEIGCQNDPSGMNFARSARIGFDGAVLVLLDGKGQPLNRLLRD